MLRRDKIYSVWGMNCFVKRSNYSPTSNYMYFYDNNIIYFVCVICALNYENEYSKPQIKIQWANVYITTTVRAMPVAIFIHKYNYIYCYLKQNTIYIGQGMQLSLADDITTKFTLPILQHAHIKYCSIYLWTYLRGTHTWGVHDTSRKQGYRSALASPLVLVL